MRTTLFFLAVAIIAFGGPGGALAQEPSQRSAAAQRGYQIAAKQCATCHAIDARDRSHDPHAPPFRSIRLHNNQTTLTQTLDEISMGGHNRMPAVPLSKPEREDLIVYLESWSR